MECDIKFNNPEGIFYSGQTLIGVLQLNLTEKFKIRKIILYVEGSAKCQWRATNREQQFLKSYTGTERYLNSKQHLINKPTELSLGSHSYSFMCELPRGLPSSLIENNGRIKYKVRVIIVRSWKTNIVSSTDFKVIRPVDLSLYPQLKDPHKQELKIELASILGSFEPILIIATVPRKAYIAKQCALMTIEVTNPTTYRVLHLKAALVKNVIYQSDTPSTETKVESSKIHELTFGKPFTKGRLKYEVNFVIPETELSSDSSYCRVLNINYDLRIKVMIEVIKENPIVNIPIIIGSIPFESDRE